MGKREQKRKPSFDKGEEIEINETKEYKNERKCSENKCL